MYFAGSARIDLNLLLSLNALLVHGSVTRAAETLGVTQSAMSRSLGRLREAFDDPLFVRGGNNRLSATPRAESLRSPLQVILSQIDQLIVPPDFAPGKARGRFRVACSSFAGAEPLPVILRDVLALAPHLEIEITTQGTADVVREDGADLALGLALNAPDELYQRVVLRDRLVCVLRQDHPAMRNQERLNLATFCDWPQLQLQLGADLRQQVDERLAQLGHQRHVSLHLPHAASALDIVETSDLILVAPEKAVQSGAPLRALRILPLPFDVPPLTVSLFWHARHHHDPAHIWLRSQLAESLLLPDAQSELSALKPVKRMRPLPHEETVVEPDHDRNYPNIGNFFPSYL